jgi:hypothetical protein
MLNWYVFVQGPSNVLAAVPEFIGKCALWPAVTLVVGVVAMSAVELRNMGRPRHDID